MKTATQIITIPLRTNADPAQILALAQELAEELAEALHEDDEYNPCTVDEDEVSVEWKE